MCRPEQRNVYWTKVLAGTLTRENDLVKDFCAGTYITAKACMLSDQYKKYAGCDMDLEVLSAAELTFFSNFLGKCRTQV